jgi:hypothetical protein
VINRNCPPLRAADTINVMDELADFAGVSGFALGAILLLMGAWGLAIVAIDRWVWAGRSDLPSGFKGPRAPRARQ